MTRDYWHTLIHPGETVHPCDMCMAEIGEPTVVETPGDAICVRCGLIHELPGPVPKPDAGNFLDGRGVNSSRTNAPVEAFYTPPAPLAGRADAAPGRFTSPASRARQQNTGSQHENR